MLGDPLGPREMFKELFAKFIAKRGFLFRPSFCQLSDQCANIVSKLGYYVNEMGRDTTIDLQSYDFRGQAKEWLRYAANWIGRRNYTIKELTLDDVGKANVEAISDAWRLTRTVKKREVRFINRPFISCDEPGVRKFFLLDEKNEPVAFTFFDPLYESNQSGQSKNIGYVTCTKRRHPKAPSYAEPAIMKFAIERFQAEGAKKLTLGLSPVIDIDDKKYRSNFLLRQSFKIGSNSALINRFFYHLQGHSIYKRRFRGKEEKVYFATPRLFPALELTSFVRLTGVI